MDLTGRDKETFLAAYDCYQNSCTGALEARTNFRHAMAKAKAILDNVRIAQQGGVDNFDPADAINASDAFLMQAEAYSDMAAALTEQAEALKETTAIAVELISKVQGEADGQAAG